jgi:choline dehydrogenase-like flavoprotein
MPHLAWCGQRRDDLILLQTLAAIADDEIVRGGPSAACLLHPGFLPAPGGPADAGLLNHLPGLVREFIVAFFRRTPMPTSPTPQSTDFSRDILGRYVCNGLDEALRSADPAIPGTRPFDIVVIGGGTFGAGLAQHAFFRGGNKRILVLEGGPLALPEHVQNLPAVGLNAAGPTSIQALREQGHFGPDKPRNEVWGLPWHSSTPFTGLAYCIGGRSVYWGGWSPRPLASELPPSRWPRAVTDDLTSKDGDFDTAAKQIGVTESNDFIFGPLHEVLRKRLAEGIRAGSVRGAVPLGQLPDGPIADTRAGERELAKLEAPLAVQGRAPRSGYFPMNKFSTVPLLIRAARMAYQESGGDDTKKRLMVVPSVHVVRLVQDRGRVTAVETNRGTVQVPPAGVVVIALGTIESTRLVLASFPQVAAQGRAGKNLIAHLRSNLTIRIPRSSLPAALPRELQASALFVKGRHDHAGGAQGHFHLQVTAAGLGARDADSEAEMWKKIPDVDHYDRFLHADDQHVVITLRGIGEMEPENPASRVFLDSELDEFGVPRAHVTLAASARDRELWDVMDRAADDGALALAAGQAYEVLAGGTWKPVAANQHASAVLPFANRRDGLGTTHHEAGTLRMGTDAHAVTDPDARIRGTANAYVAGPALFPTVGSPNPMLTGIALGRRLARHLVPARPAAVAPGALFDGATLDGWHRAGPGQFVPVAGVIRSVGGSDIGLLWHARPTPADFTLELEWRCWTDDANSGVFVRFRDPSGNGADNPAWTAVRSGFEIQIDALGRPDGLDIHKTGAIYGQPKQTRTPAAARPAGEWNSFQIQVRGQQYTVLLNGQKVTEFTNTDPGRGQPTTQSASAHIGLQAYPGQVVDFRNIVLRELAPAPSPTPASAQAPAVPA